MQLAPPTDNLYKFMAIFGMVMIISGVILHFTMHEMTHDDTNALIARLIEKETTEISTRETSFIVKRHNWMGRISSAMIGGGFMVSFWGFWLWYCRVQIHEDALLTMRVQQERKKSGS